MNLKQRILKWIYPLLMQLARRSPKHNRVLHNERHIAPAQPLGGLEIALNNGRQMPLATGGKKLLLVNTASNCGFTGQFDELQALYDRFKGQLEIIGFPANDFKEQEKGSDEEIASFCKVNFGVQFPLAKKTSVVKGPQQNPVFGWLTDPARNGWNAQAPDWNFSKYLIDEAGVLTHYFGPSVSPLAPEVIEALEKK